MLNLESVIAEKRLAQEDIDDPYQKARLTLQATGDHDKAEDVLINGLDQRMRQGLPT